MPSFDSLHKKIQAFKAIVAEKSISPKLVGSLLEDIIQLIKDTVSAGSNGESLYAEEAGHAVSADEAIHAVSADSAVSAQVADEATHAASADSANEAAHAAEADEAQHAASAAALDEDSPTREDFLSRKNDDTAEGLVKFLKGILSGAYEAGKSGAKLDADGNLEAAAALVRGLLRAWDGVLVGKGNGTAKIDADGNAEFGSAAVRLLLSALGGIVTGSYSAGKSGGKFDSEGNIEAAEAVIRGLLKAAKLICPDIITESVASELFTDGFAGSGFRLWKDAAGETHLTVDTLTVRRVMTVFELLVARIRSVGGTLFVSAANGKVESALRLSGGQWRITFEDEYHGFIAGDYMRCQTFRGSESKSYWVRISSVSGKAVTVPAAEWVGQSQPAAGDEVVLCGSDNAKRQNGILISATEDGQPRIEVFNGIKGRSFDGCLRVRLGCLDDIVDEQNFPGELSPKGYGIYSDNAYFKGEFVLSGKDGGNIRTLFAAMDGRITAAVSDIDNNIAAKIEVAAGQIKTEVINELTGEDGAITNLQTQITQNAEAISAQASKVEGNTSAIAQLKLTAEGISAEITKQADRIAGNTDEIAKVSASISATAEQIRSELKDTTDAQDTRISSMEQTADGIKNTVSSMQSELDSQAVRIADVEQTADGISIEVSKLGKRLNDTVDTVEDVSLRVTLEADRLSSEIKNRTEGLESKIEQTAEAIRTEVSDNKTDLESKIEQTADAIKLEVSDGLAETGIDIENGIITLNGDTRFLDSSGKETAMFKDGRISAERIDADSLTARRVEVQYPDSGNPCVSILPTTKAMRIYDNDSGEMVQELSGIRHSNPVNTFYGGTQGVDITFTLKESTRDPITGTDNNPYIGGPDAPVAVTGVIDSTSNILSLIMRGGSIKVEAQAFSGVGSYAEGSADLLLQQLDTAGNVTDEIVVASVTVRAEGIGTNGSLPKTQTLALEGKRIISNTPGRFRLAVDYWGQMLNGEVKVSWTGLSAEYNTAVYRSNYFANGYLLGVAVNNYVTVYHTDDGMVQEARMGDLGVRLSRDGLRIRALDNLWVPVPLPFYQGRINVTSGGTLSIGNDNGYAPPRPTVRKISASELDVVFPDEWKKLKNGNFVSYIYTEVQTYNASVRAAVLWSNSECIRIGYSGNIVLTEIKIYMYSYAR